MTKGSGRKAKASGATTATALRIVSNAAAQNMEQIAPAVLPETRARSAPAPCDAPSAQSEDPIAPCDVAADDHPRLAIGARIRRNDAHQRTQKIARADLRAPAEDEIGYKKLFTCFEAGFLAQDITALRACLSPAFQWHLPNGEVVYGRDEALAEMERRFAMPNGPKFTASVWRFKETTVIQTYDVEYMGPDGRWRASRGMDLYEIGGGLITRKDAYWKMIP